MRGSRPGASPSTASSRRSARRSRQATSSASTASRSARRKKHVYIALNKPVGITCTTERARRGQHRRLRAVIRERIFPIGRLDKDSEGLILLTNNGDIVNEILRSENEHEKEYVVTVDRPVTEIFLNGMASGVRILGTVTKPCKVRRVAAATFRIVLTQGLNRQIRRMCSFFGYKVLRLQRVRIINLTLGGAASRASGAS